MAYIKKADRTKSIKVTPSDEKFIKELVDKFGETQTAWNKIHEKSREDVKFFGGVQYDEQWARAARARGRKTQISVNMLPQYVQVIENQIRQMDINITVHATDEQGSEDTAQVFEGMFRHIEQVSNAKTAYISAFGKNGALVPGIGFVKWGKQYLSPESFEQELILEEVKDPFRILPDYYAKKSDFSDADHWFEFDIYSKEDFKRKFPGAQLASFDRWHDQHVKHWIDDDSVQVVKYWYKDHEQRLLIELEDGTKGFADDLGYNKMTPTENAPQVPLTLVEATLPEFEGLASRPMAIVNSRLSEECKVKWFLTNGVEKLEEGEWDDSEFPFVAFVGTDTFYDGNRVIYGLIRYTHDCQKMINYLASKFIEKIGAMNKSPWIAADESIPEPLRDAWNKSNIDEKSVLYFREYVNGRQMTAPFRGDNVEPAVQSLLAGFQMFVESLKKTMGVPDAMMGVLPQQSIQQSGLAVSNLAEKGAQSNHHFADNMVLSMKRVADLGIRLMPKIYDTARAVRIVNPDGDSELIKINEIFNHKGMATHYALTTGQYGVTVDTGPSYATKKAEITAQILEFLAIEPQLTPVVADLIVKQSDWDTTGMLSDRIKGWQASTPNLAWIAQSDQSQQNIPPQARAAMQQMQAQHSQLLQALQQAQQQIQMLSMEKQSRVVDNQGKMRIEQMKSINNLTVEKLRIQQEIIKEQNEDIRTKMKLQLDHIKHHQKSVLDMIKHHDKTRGEETPEQYAEIERGIEE